MTMHSSILEIQRARLSRLFSDIQGQSFSNSKLGTHIKELSILFTNVEERIKADKLDKDEIENLNGIIRFIFDNLEYLEDSVIDIVPFETIFCLENALIDWIQEQYIIVVTLKRGEYFFCLYYLATTFTIILRVNMELDLLIN